jgi:two-component system, chemotaxis family, chemotaxis protein CheY
MVTQRPANDCRPEIMIIDDDACLRDALAHVLERRGYLVRPCCDALEGLDQLAAHAAPDLILLDLLMPRMNGWEFRVKQRQVPQWAGIPLIVLSADTSVKAAAIHADAYLAKPIEQRVLIETVETVLQPRLRATEVQPEEVCGLREFAAQFGRTLSEPLSFMVGNLELAQCMATDIEGRLKGPEAFSMVGLAQLLARVQRGAERLASLTRDLSARCRFGLAAPQAQLAAGEPAADLPSNVMRRFPSVLVVDDEPMVCDMIAAILSADYNVATFTDPRAALASILQGSFDVILCDLMMPGVTGMEIYAQLARQRPALTERIIFLSAGVFSEELRGFLAASCRPQLHKPFQREELLDVIDAHLPSGP